jgi:hypothetical protein
VFSRLGKNGSKLMPSTFLAAELFTEGYGEKTLAGLLAFYE